MILIGKQFKRYFLIVTGTILPVAIFYGVIIKMAINVPFQDDFDGLLAPILGLSKAGLSWWDKWNIYYAQDDERRIVINRMAAHIQYLCTGEFSFRKHQIYGSLLMLIPLWVCWSWLKKTTINPLYFIPIPFLLFNIQYFDAIFWTIIPFDSGVYLWGIWAIFLLNTNSEYSFFWALLTAILSLYSDVAGVLLLPIGIIILLINNQKGRAIVWLVVLGVLITYYFAGLVVPSYRPTLAQNLSHPAWIVQTWFCMQGLWADIAPNFPMEKRILKATAVGILAFWFLFWNTFKDIKIFVISRKIPKSSDLFLYGSLFFLLGIFTLFALGRASEGISAAFLSRYRLIYLLWAVVLYLLILAKTPDWLLEKKSVKVGILLIGVIFWVNSYFQYWGEMLSFKNLLLSDLYEWKYNRAIPSSPIYLSMPQKIDDIYEESIKKNIFVYENPVYEAFRFAPTLYNKIVGMELLNEKDFISVEMGGLINTECYALFLEENTKELHILPMNPEEYSLRNFLLGRKYIKPPHTSVPMLKRYLKAKKYAILLGVKTSKGHFLKIPSNIIFEQ